MISFWREALFEWDEDDRRTFRRLFLTLAVCGAIQLIENVFEQARHDVVHRRVVDADTVLAAQAEPAFVGSITPVCDGPTLAISDRHSAVVAAATADRPSDDLATAAQELMTWGEKRGIRARITSMQRTTEKQAELFRRWRAGRSPYPAARPGYSRHEVGRAFDLAVDPSLEQSEDALLRELGEEWERRGGAWGGRFADPIHFQK